MSKCKGTMRDGIYNCFGDYNDSLCYNCIHNDSDKDVKKTGSMFKSYTDAIDELFAMLKGEGLPEGVTCKMPKLKPDVAFSVISFLQEVMGCLPSNIEMCQECKDLFDTDSEGCYLDDQYELGGKTLPRKYWGHWCDACVPNVDFELS